MTTQESSRAALRVFQYTVASADMYYAEVEQRDVLLGTDEWGHIRMWGRTAYADPSCKLSLCQVFLEYGMYCSSWCSPAEALFHMQDFGERLGHCLAQFMRERPGLLGVDDPTARAVEQILWAIDSDFQEEHIESGVRFLASDCGLEEVAEACGLSDLELARHGVNALCRALLLDMNPRLLVTTAPDTLPEFMFLIKEPALA